jgi:hypothetical protein
MFRHLYIRKEHLCHRECLRCRFESHRHVQDILYVVRKVQLRVRLSLSVAFKFHAMPSWSTVFVRIPACTHFLFSAQSLIPTSC